MNKVLTNYCYSWYRTNVPTEEATANQRERWYRTNVLTAEATADPRPMATARGSTDRIV